MRSTEKGKVEKKGRFTIIDLPSNESSPSERFRDGHILSPTAQRHGDKFDDDGFKKQRVKQKGRFTIIDLDPNTSSPESGLGKGFQDDTNDSDDQSGKESEVQIIQPTQSQLTNVSNVDTNPPPMMDTTCKDESNDIQMSNTNHHAGCCFHRNPSLRSTLNVVNPLCTMIFPNSPDLAGQSSHVAVPLRVYQHQQSMIAALLQQNEEMRSLIEVLQNQQKELMEVAQSIQNLAADEPQSH